MSEAITFDAVTIRRVNPEQDKEYAQAAASIYEQELEARFLGFEWSEVYVALASSALSEIVVGMSALSPGIKDNELYIAALAVQGVYQHKGVGSLLIAHAAGVGVSRGRRVLSVLPYGSSRGFYEACGFQDGINSQEESEHTGIMLRSLV